MITHTPLVAGNLPPIKTLVARQWPTVKYTYVRVCIHTYVDPKYKLCDMLTQWLAIYIRSYTRLKYTTVHYIHTYIRRILSHPVILFLWDAVGQPELNHKNRVVSTPNTCIPQSNSLFLLVQSNLCSYVL